MKILSIDYDYFQKADKDTLRRCYPDGVDLPPELSQAVWAAHYAVQKQKDLLDRVVLNEEEFSLAKEIILAQRADIPVMMTCSHKHIYDFAHRLADTNERLEVVNVDMHHDFFNDNPQVDCGNWVGFLHKEYKHFKFGWVANPAGLDVYGFEQEETDLAIKTSLKGIQDKQFDALFLCRSDIWSVPHLDYGFEELMTLCKERFSDIYIEDTITETRDISKTMKEIQRKVEEYRNELR